jgi:hypothetical protein
MLHKVSTTYEELAKLVPELQGREHPSVRKKQLLRDMARRGDPRPTQKTAIGRSLSQYTSPANTSYDKALHKELKRLRPDWFMSQTQIADQKKKKLFEMARNGEKRPSHDKTKLGQDLSNYTRKSSPAYDPEFHRELMRLRPDWFGKASLEDPDPIRKAS